LGSGLHGRCCNGSRPDQRRRVQAPGEASFVRENASANTSFTCLPAAEFLAVYVSTAAACPCFAAASVRVREKYLPSPVCVLQVPRCRPSGSWRTIVCLSQCARQRPTVGVSIRRLAFDPQHRPLLSAGRHVPGAHQVTSRSFSLASTRKDEHAARQQRPAVAEVNERWRSWPNTCAPPAGARSYSSIAAVLEEGFRVSQPQRFHLPSGEKAMQRPEIGEFPCRSSGPIPPRRGPRATAANPCRPAHHDARHRSG